MDNIEIVCWGNNGRSPVIELIAKKYALSIGTNIQIYSSGLLVNSDFSDSLSLEIIANVRAAGITGDTNEELDKNMALKEAKLRNRALELCGYEPIKNHIPKQTMPRKDVDLILAAGNRELKVLSELYAGKPQPPMSTLEEYSGKPVHKPYLKTWLTDVQVHISYIYAIEIAVPCAIDRYLKEFGTR